jgi:hypothetical protein
MSGLIPLCKAWARAKRWGAGGGEAGAGHLRWVVDYLVKYVRPDKVDGCYLLGINGNTEPLWNAKELLI